MTSKSVAVLLVLLAVVTLGACESPLANSVTPSASSKEKCEERWFSTSSDDPRCYALQKALSEAVEGRSRTRVEELLLDGANVNGGYYQSIPVLEHAASLGANEIVELLITNGARVNRVRPLGGTALKAAVTYRHAETVRILLASKADLCEGTEGSALRIAEESQDKEILTILKDAGASKCP